MTDVLAILVCWRLSYLIVYEDGPLELVARFRYAIGIRYDEYNQRRTSNELAKLFNCMFCTSVWVGWLVALVVYREPVAFWYGLGYSGGAMLVHNIIKTSR